jgi:hypothetical protein
MSDIFTESEKLELAKTTEQRMSQASQQLAAFNQAVLDVYANWSGYVVRETDETKLEAARVRFAAKARELVNARKVGLAQALDVIAGGMLDAEGNPLTRQDLLNELAEVT